MTISIWREIQKQNFTSISTLIDFLQITENERLNYSASYPLNLPFRLANKIRKNDLSDPILRQFLPLAEEREESSFPLEPVEDSKFRKEAKLLKKYEGRVLLLLTSSCVMNCRFCFRQHFPYEKKEKGFERELKQIAEDPSITEVILSGGDPLSLGNQVLAHLIEGLSEIPHVQRLRFHTRFSIGIPERIDQGFLDILKKTRLQTWYIIHTNHPREWDQEVIEAHRRIQRLGIPVLSMTVLLKGVNDSAEVLHELFQLLVNHGIMPYYLHQLDRVKGAHHFETTEADGLQIMKELSTKASGYALPRYVKEVPGEPGKTILF
jgi:EF-P beta-lysylation protein EpmB